METRGSGSVAAAGEKPQPGAAPDLGCCAYAPLIVLRSLSQVPSKPLSPSPQRSERSPAPNRLSCFALPFNFPSGLLGLVAACAAKGTAPNYGSARTLSVLSAVFAGLGFAVCLVLFILSYTGILKPILAVDLIPRYLGKLHPPPHPIPPLVPSSHQCRLPRAYSTGVDAIYCQPDSTCQCGNPDCHEWTCYDEYYTGVTSGGRPLSCSDLEQHPNIYGCHYEGWTGGCDHCGLYGIGHVCPRTCGLCKEYCIERLMSKEYCIKEDFFGM